MKTPLPSKDMILQARAGTMAIQHPILQGAYELASLHEARVDKNADIGAIDRELDRLMSHIDSWVTADQPPTFDAAYQLRHRSWPTNRTASCRLHEFPSAAADSATLCTSGTLAIEQGKHMEHSDEWDILVERISENSYGVRVEPDNISIKVAS
ncbi:hypothetical protein [Nocardia sp. NPDC049526]|uniref:hypothetical protein n=1 Tax=Nocardia sp. NPDC049526 TaxID=3364316 RepID=UPI003798930C